MPKLIQTKSLTRTFKQGHSLVHALQDINIEIGEGEFVAITGKSGSGKSTLLNILGGLDKASTGEVYFEGKLLSACSSAQLAEYRKKSVGIVFQSFNLLPRYSALGNISFALAVGGVSRKKRNEMAESLLDKVGLLDRAKHLPSELSGGESQRVAIARALANNPKLIFADEPTGNLDSQNASMVLELLNNLVMQEGKTLVLITHDVESAEKMANRVYKLKDGKIIQS